MGKNRLKEYSVWAVKIGLILFGLADFLGLLSSSLDIFDKILTSALLLFFWYELRPGRFMFGKESRWLDILILSGFYIMSLNIFLRFVEGYGEAFLESQAYHLIQYYTNLFSVSVGPLLLLAAAVIVATRHGFGEKSVVHSIYCFFVRKGESWKDISRKGNMMYAPLRAVMGFVALYLIANYFFLLISQWFVVSLDKSLLIVAVLFAVKDIKSRNIEAINKIGNFDDVMLGMITRLFTDPKYSYLGFGFLLMFHYLSELSIFFLPYLTHVIGMDAGFYGLSPESHQSLFSLFSTEQFSSGLEAFSAVWTYALSALGIVVMILLPVVLMFFNVFNVDMLRIEQKKRYQIPLVIMLVSAMVFVFCPWISQVQIKGSIVGAYGVDFVTGCISGSSPAGFTWIFIISALLIIAGMALRKRHFSELASAVLYITSMTYLGLYCWNFFSSSSAYYSGLIGYFTGQKSYLLALNFEILRALDFMFYIGVFIILCYHLSQYIIRNIIKELMSNRFIIGWSIGIIISSICIISMITQENHAGMMALLMSFLASTLLFNLAFYFHMAGKKEFRDDFILATNIIIAIYVATGIIGLFLESSAGIRGEAIDFASPFVVSAAAILLLKMFGLKTKWKIRPAKITASIGIGLLFGVFFALAKEPIVPLFSGNIFVISLFMLAVAFSEEMLFRNFLFRLTKRSFGTRAATALQAAVFALMHFLFIGEILQHYGGSIAMVALYFIMLFVFSCVMAFLVGREEKAGENDLAYPIAAHFIANMALYAILFF